MQLTFRQILSLTIWQRRPERSGGRISEMPGVGKVCAGNSLLQSPPQYNGSSPASWSAVISAVLLGLCLHGVAVADQHDYGTQIDPPRPLPAVTLEDQSGDAFTWVDRQGRPALLFFGFTHCPHICPTTLSLLKGVRDRLPAGLAEQLEVWLVTVDPMRDSSEILRAYLQNFGEGFYGARADLGVMVPLFKTLGIGYAYRADEGGGYDVDHTTSVFLLDPRGNLSHVYTAPHDAQELLRSVQGRLQEMQK